MAVPVFAVGLDLASVNAAAVGLPPAGAEPMTSVMAAPPLSEVEPPVRDLQMAETVCDVLWEWSGLDAYRILAVEHTPFAASQTNRSLTGVVRGSLYRFLRSEAPYHFVFLVNPSTWRSFHGITTTGKAKFDAYDARAAELGFVAQHPLKKPRQDLTAAFLISKVAAAVASRHPRATPLDLDKRELRVVESIMKNPNLRIYPR